ncbi:uncharacterized protein si:ch211-199g17.2 isoform X1 [Xyrichtys novacula]|uniref:Uncharacterized protein si:ch211-199g17.2 isoform X1 n=1 Tax=Xyrichtys novacula TaxID=13765 RepID=A0AAV1HHB6_XYRNO|nr:uncharacterized protein si:ch211-199g17.2 isoform X1 [Xyrichtys novacula]
MQPLDTQKGCPPPTSQLLDSLKVYLNNKKRLQPIIGLSCIIECVKKGAEDRQLWYLCEVCKCQLSKADIRNHIMGSLHRYNYIKALHQDLVSEWKEVSDLSKLAWPLMEIAKMLEEKEGPGDVQTIELEDTVFQTVVAFEEDGAAALLDILKNSSVQAEPGRHFEASVVQLEPVHSERAVLLSTNQQRWSDTDEMLADYSESRDFLCGYSGSEPLIGFSRVVECRDEDGHTYCFLCHCCRVRSNEKDIISHLTSSSHLVNYLMETRPNQMEVITADISNDSWLLQSVAERVEQEEGRGELEVVVAPESFCVQLTGRSYHWCIKMLSVGWTHTDILNAEKGPDVSGEMPETGTKVLSEYKKRRNTVFRVSLPLAKGPLLLKRTSFSEDTFLPEADKDLSASDSDLECCRGTGPENDELDFAATLGPEGNLAVSIYEEGMGFISDIEQLNQFENLSGTEEQHFYKGNNDQGQHTFEDTASEMLNRNQNHEVPPTQNEWTLPPGWNTQNLVSYSVPYRQMEWYNQTSQCRVDPKGPIENAQWERISDAPPYQNYYQQQSYMYYNWYYQQQPHYQYTAEDGSHQQAAVEGRMGSLVDQIQSHQQTAPPSFMTYMSPFQT